MDMIDGIIVGAAAAAIGTILATKYLEGHASVPVGGARPNQNYAPGQPVFAPQYGRPTGPVAVEYPDPLGPFSPPVQQNQPITEAAYNQQPVTYSPAFGGDSSGSDIEVLTI